MLVKLLKFCVLILTLMFFSGCLITSGLTKSIRSTVHIQREFELNTAPQCYKIIKGYNLGNVSKDSLEFIHLAYDTALSGKNRVLNILLPINQKQSIYPVVYESKKTAFAGKPVYLMMIRYVPMTDNPNNLYNQLYGFTKELNPDPVFFLQQIKSGNSDYEEDSVIVFVINFSNIYHWQDFSSIIWSKNDQSQWQVNRDFYYQQFCTIIQYPKIKWKNRSRMKKVLMYSAYALTIPADIITFPLQWFILKGQPK